jgi:arsenical-resistance protein 2
LNLPAQSLYPTIPTLYSVLSQAKVSKVVWYCGQYNYIFVFTKKGQLIIIIKTGSSQGRGTRAANWFAEHLEEQKDREMESLILEGGIKGWAAAGYDYTQLMDEYDESKWKK